MSGGYACTARLGLGAGLVGTITAGVHFVTRSRMVSYALVVGVLELVLARARDVDRSRARSGVGAPEERRSPVPSRATCSYHPALSSSPPTQEVAP